jgi:hypothetical protein
VDRASDEQLALYRAFVQGEDDLDTLDRDAIQRARRTFDEVDLTTTQRYMYLTPAAIDGAIRLLDHGTGGDVMETGENGR